MMVLLVMRMVLSADNSAPTSVAVENSGCMRRPQSQNYHNNNNHYQTCGRMDFDPVARHEMGVRFACFFPRERLRSGAQINYYA